MRLTPRPASCLFAIRRIRLASLFPLACILLLGMACSSLAAPKIPFKTVQVVPPSTEQQYKAAKENASRLEIDALSGKDRGKWLGVAREFRRIHLAERKGPLGASALYMSSKTYRKMYTLFMMPADLEASLNSYLELADLYPGNSLADDALFEAAECARLTKGKEHQADMLLRKIVTAYPQGDFYDKASARIKAPINDSPSVAVTSPPNAQEKDLTMLSPVKYWSSDHYTRIVIQSAAPVSFTAGLLEANNKQSRQLFVDIPRSLLPPKFYTTVPVNDGLLKQIRSERKGEDAVRVIVDLASLGEYKVFSLSDPYRTIVDIQGNAGAGIESATNSGPAQPFSPVPGGAPEENKLTSEENELAVLSLIDQKKRRPTSDSSPVEKSLPREKLSLAQQLGLGIRKIVIDPGHGGKDPGAMAFGLKEKDIVLKISRKIANILKTNNRYEVILTRNKDVFIPLEERTAIANKTKSDLFISIHVNAHSDQASGGIETYFLNLATDASAMRVAALENATSTHSIGELQDILSSLIKNSKVDESSRLARFVQTNLVSGFGRANKLRDLGVKQAPFYVLIGAEMPAILAEIAFITNPSEAKLLQNEQYLDKIAEQLAAGIAAYVDHHHTAAIKLQ